MARFSVICFDADDTLWVNEPYFQEAEGRFAALLEDFLPHHSVSRELLQTEIANLPIYGYGVKAFMLSMVETALRISANTLRPESIHQIISIGRDLLDRPIELLEGVEETLGALKGHYRLVVATKGDLLDQERKLEKSGLAPYFHHIEIMSEKREGDYAKLLRHLDIPAERFMMVGNSLKSDVLPVLALGGHGVHVPYHTTWAAEKVEFEVEHANFRQVAHLREVLSFLLP
jgi:putative hydrolase of the HAD superfamily